MTGTATWTAVTASREQPHGVAVAQTLDVAEECPVTLRYHGITHAVMMATPDDLEDFALGFSIAEGAALQPDHVRATAVVPQPDGGVAVDITLHPHSLHAFLAQGRRRNRISHGGCGVCGVDDLDAALPLGRVAGRQPDTLAVGRALSDLRGFQPLGQRTHGTHAAAWAGADGRIMLAREDIGRHNAMDKLVGAVHRAGLAREEGFCVITSRCSVEMAQKAIAAGFPALVAVSAPTSMAITWARRAGLVLMASARGDGFTVFSPAAPVTPAAAAHAA